MGVFLTDSLKMVDVVVTHVVVIEKSEEILSYNLKLKHMIYQASKSNEYHCKLHVTSLKLSVNYQTKIFCMQ